MACGAQDLSDCARLQPFRVELDSEPDVDLFGDLQSRVNRRRSSKLYFSL